ncbi:hypothetical protein [Arcticibacter sp. MXS-1]|uniref:hypothetical protein n=1 Tax=Arcticibacter sp. MXS-1 TaxID=3341726 RepID=UPI0035A86359
MFIFSCRRPISPYIISKEDSLRKVTHTNAQGIVLDLPKVKYAPYTFVIDSNNIVYFYAFPEERKQEGTTDGDEPNTIGLLPNQVFIIPQGHEERFFETNVLSLKTSRVHKNVLLASFRDTITNNLISYINKVSSDPTKKISMKIRLALPEERRVIRFTLNGQYYPVGNRSSCACGIMEMQQ